MGSLDAPLQMLVANLDSSDYLGPHRHRPHLQRPGEDRRRRSPSASSTAEAQQDEGHQAVRVRRPEARSTSTDAAAGDIVCLAGIAGHHHRRDGHRSRAPACRCRSIAVDEPTVSMIFGVNTSPLAGREGQYVTSRQVRDRLERELHRQRVDPPRGHRQPETVKVVGRGELQLSILIEMMRREGFELQVSRPEIVTKEIERPARWSRSRTSSSTCRRTFRASSSRRSGGRKGTMTKMVNHGSGRVRHGVPDSGARADRLPLAVPDRHPGHRHHEPPVCRLGAVARRHPVARRPARWWPTGPASRPPTRSVEPAGAGRDLHRAGDDRSTRG